MIYVKIFGSKRTATNYIAELVRSNYRNDKSIHVLVHDLGGKHEIPHLAPYVGLAQFYPGLSDALMLGRLRLFGVIKDPYAWAVSTIKAHLRWSKVFAREYAKDPVAALRPRVERYKEMYPAAYQQRAMVYVTPYERLLEDFEAETDKIRYELALPTLAWQNVTNRMTPNDTVSERPFDPTYYTERRYWGELPPVVRDYITATMNWPFLARFGYKPIGPTGPCGPS